MQIGFERVSLPNIKNESTLKDHDKPESAVAQAYNNKTKYLIFRPFSDPMDQRPSKPTDKGYFFKFFNPNTDIKLIRYTLEDNGFREYPYTSKQNTFSNVAISYGNKQQEYDWSVMWSCQIMKSNVFQGLKKF